MNSGRKGWIFAEPKSWRCPVKIILTFYKRMGFNLRNRGIYDQSFIMSTVRNIRGIQVSDGQKPVSASTYLNDLRLLCAAVGYSGHISSKSAKVAGTSAAFAAGLTTLDLMSKGRWQSDKTSLHYRQMTPAYRRKLGAATSVFRKTQHQTGPEPARQHNEGPRRAPGIFTTRTKKKQRWFQEVQEATGALETPLRVKLNRIQRANQQAKVEEAKKAADKAASAQRQKQQLIKQRQEIEQERERLVEERNRLLEHNENLKCKQRYIEGQIKEQKDEKERLKVMNKFLEDWKKEIFESKQARRAQIAASQRRFQQHGWIQQRLQRQSDQPSYSGQIRGVQASCPRHDVINQHDRPPRQNRDNQQTKDLQVNQPSSQTN